MKGLFKRIVWAFRYTMAVRKADKIHSQTGRKVYVLYIGGKLVVKTKGNISRLVSEHRFKKGVTVRDVEKMALYVTR